ncbi:hypothetical protein [Pedobacter cryoconitis]|uniref:hypothetical protein n=1 Tax=Pedobacter cryoconitis TaxID=188932 RepID=UPI001621310F|nr:hypothetical protein [Pedobacter cryoconitis]MBB5643977.1 hypothetical protein [Pedobacter cryoconitis]
MSKLIHPFDSPDKILNSVKYFKGLDLSKQDPKTLFPLISKTFGTIPFEGLSLKKGTSLFRARKNSQLNDEKFQNLSDLSIRNDHDIKSFGRANTPGQGIFYCSIDKAIAAREVTQWQLNDLGALVKKGVSLSNYQPFTQFMTISEWKTKEDLFLVLHG